MLSSIRCFQIFEQSIIHYHVWDNVDQCPQIPYAEGSFENMLFKKNWIDTVQWHLEDTIRDPNIEAQIALNIKRRIDKSNQDRTDLVEKIDDTIFSALTPGNENSAPPVNTETPGWAIDRLSILALKIHHMRQETERKDADEMHIQKCKLKLETLLEQKKDLIQSIDELLEDLAAGRRRMKLYKQMKMYNDPALNPVLYLK